MDGMFHRARDRRLEGLDEREWSQPWMFMQLADPQFGMWSGGIEEEMEMVRTAVEHINRLQPKFVIVCGNLINDLSGKPNKRKLRTAEDHVEKFKSVIREIDPRIPLVCLCGHHDVGDHPNRASIDFYKSRFGDDYLEFWAGGSHCIVINSSLENTHSVEQGVSQTLADEQAEWLERVLCTDGGSSKQGPTFVFSHCPPFIAEPDEPQGYFNLKPELRQPLLQKLKEAGVCKWFCGHYHRNAGGWDGPLEVVVTASVGCIFSTQEHSPAEERLNVSGIDFSMSSCSHQTSGLRCVCISKERHVHHKFFTLDCVPEDIDPSGSSHGWPGILDPDLSVKGNVAVGTKACAAGNVLEGRLKVEEEEARGRAEKEARMQADEESRAKAEEEARMQSEEEARARAKEHEATLKAEEDSRTKAEEEARVQAEKEARAKAEEARLKAEAEARIKAEEENQLKADQEARAKAEQEAMRKSEEEARLKAEEEARLKAEQEARAKAAEEARLKAEEEARAKAEEEASLKAEEEASAKAEQEAMLKAEEEARLKAEEEANSKAEEESRLKAEEEARIKAEKQAMFEADQKARAKAAEEARMKAEEEARAKAEEEARLKSEEEASVKAEEEARLKAEQEARAKAEEEAMLKAKHQARAKALKEARLKAEEWARANAEEEEEEARLKAEGKTKAKAEEEEEEEEEEEARLKGEEAARFKAEEEARAKAEEEARLKQEAVAKSAEGAKFKAEEEAPANAEEEPRLQAEQETRTEAGCALDSNVKGDVSEGGVMVATIGTQASIDQRWLAAEVGETDVVSDPTAKDDVRVSAKIVPPVSVVHSSHKDQSADDPENVFASTVEDHLEVKEATRSTHNRKSEPPRCIAEPESGEASKSKKTDVETVSSTSNPLQKEEIVAQDYGVCRAEARVDQPQKGVATAVGEPLSVDTTVDTTVSTEDTTVSTEAEHEVVIDGEGSVVMPGCWGMRLCCYVTT